jgi:BirA family biotin operon repressor/biotin-[acetyl-CoA-carboxylase] ligase
LSREEIERELIQRAGRWTSGQDLAEALGISRAAVWKAVESLRAEGYEIEASRRGYRMRYAPDLLREEVVKAGLATEFVGRTFIYHHTLASTNAEAKRIAPSAEDGSVVVAEVQTAGRGRMERSWSSPRGGVWMSVILKPHIPPALAFRVNIAASVAVARALAALYRLDVKIKWPNDLTVGEKKVCGILTEIGAEMDTLDYAVVGIGINANLDPATFPEGWKATSISREAGGDIQRVGLVQRALEELERCYGEMTTSFDLIHQEWSSRSSTLGRRVKIITRSCEFEGMAVVLEADGALLVRKDDGSEERVLAGDCVHLRPAVDEDA